MSITNDYMNGYMDSQLSWILKTEYNMSSCEIDSILQSIKSMRLDSTVKTANFTFKNNGLYQNLIVNIPEDNMTFTGQCGGSSIANIEGYGSVWAENMNFQALYNNTNSFLITITVGYTGVYFFNENNSLIGMFNSIKSNSPCSYNGSGPGKWS